MTIEEYNALTPGAKGYACFMHSQRPDSAVPKECPYSKADQPEKFAEFMRGKQWAIEDCMDYGGIVP